MGNELPPVAGYTLDEVVHDYGDLCQAVNQELAHDQELPITAGEFHTLNSCLDHAIAGAVTEYGRRQELLEQPCPLRHRACETG